MSKFISISGPCHSGKSSLCMNLMRRYQGREDILILPDLQDVVWKSLVDKCEFGEFTEVFSDRTYLFMYIGQWVSKYKEIINKYRNDNNIKVVIFDGGTLDILIYSILHMWFHYPAYEVQGKMVTDLLSLDGILDRIYMILPNDDMYPVHRGDLTLRQRMADFNRNRSMEISLYDTYRKREDVVTLSDDQSISEKMMIDILEKEYGVSL